MFIYGNRQKFKKEPEKRQRYTKRKRVVCEVSGREGLSGYTYAYISW